MAEIFHESFEGTGFEHLGNESVGAGCTGTEDSSGPGGALPDELSQCYYVVKASGAGVNAYLDYGSSISALYLRVYVYVSALSVGSNEGFNFAGAAATSDVANNGSAALAFFNDGGTYRFRLAYHIAAGWQYIHSDSYSITTGQWYCVEGRFESGTNTWELRVDDVSHGQASGTADRDRRYIFVGGAGTYTETYTAYFDAVKIDNATWVGPEITVGVPTVTTQAPTNTTETAATGNGNVTDDGGATVSDRGVCWGTSANPTTAGDHAHAAAGGEGAFTALITGLSSGSTYHVRAYAINSDGTAYGSDVTFSTLGTIVTVTSATDVSIIVGACTAIPRWKIVADPSDAATLYLVHGRNSSAGAVWRSLDYGLTWATLGTQAAVTDYHANLDADSAGRVFVGVTTNFDSGSGVARMRRWNGSSWDTDIQFDDYATGYGVAHVLVGNTNDMWVFTRGGGTDAGDVHWHRSTDNGATFTSSGHVYTRVYTGRMGGQMINGQPACLIGDIVSGHYQYSVYRWDGSDSFDLMANDPVVAVSGDEMNRMWSVVELANGDIHLVYRDIITAAYVLRHCYRTYAGTWSSPTTVQTLTGAGDGECVLSAQANTAFLAYSDTRAAVKHIYRRSLVSGGAWSDETQVDDSGSQNCGNCNAARSISGEYWIVMWDQGADSTNRSIRVRAIAAPLADSLSVFVYESTIVDEFNG